jgi:hypothetical protein
MKFGKFVARCAAITAGVVWGVYKGVQEIRAKPSEAAEILAEVTDLSPHEAQELLDEGTTPEELKQLVRERFGEWGSA